jgi:hypothetical protein
VTAAVVLSVNGSATGAPHCGVERVFVRAIERVNRESGVNKSHDFSFCLFACEKLIPPTLDANQ